MGRMVINWKNGNSRHLPGVELGEYEKFEKNFHAGEIAFVKFDMNDGVNRYYAVGEDRMNDISGLSFIF
jgi:hypothetical protein